MWHTFCENHAEKRLQGQKVTKDGRSTVGASGTIHFQLSEIEKYRFFVFLNEYFSIYQIFNLLAEGTQTSEISEINKSNKIYLNLKRTQILEISTAHEPKLSILTLFMSGLQV